MSFSQDNGYTPVSFEDLMSFVREGINTQFLTSYTEETFLGTGWYKYFYPLVQKIQENEVKTSEIFAKLQQYIALTNEMIKRPTVSYQGIIDAFAEDGFVIAVKPIEDADAGKIFIAVDLDDEAVDYDDKKLEVCGKIRDFVCGGIVSQGDEVESLTLSNGQAFDFKFNLPNRIPVLLRLTLVESENNRLAIPTDETIRTFLFDKINSLYQLGKNFEPERYYNVSDAPWAATTLLEWSDDDGANWHPEIFDSEYVDLFTFGLEDIAVVLS